jgi:hypothetical protein
MNYSRMPKRWYFSPLWKSPHAGIKGAGGDSLVHRADGKRQIPPNPPFPKGGVCVSGGEA